MYRTLLIILTVSLAQQARAQALAEDGGVDTRFQEDQRLEVDTALGQFTIGVSGINENEKLGATGGDVEFGYLYRFEFDSDFPRVAELRPFVFNRADSTDASAYESLGVGVGVRLSLRKKYEENNWFVRLSALTPTEAYRERYDLERDLESVYEVFAGYEVPFDDPFADREMRRRLTPPRLIRLGVSAKMFDLAKPITPEVVKHVHSLMIGAYLSKVWQLHGGAHVQRTLVDSDWPVLALIERVTGEALTPDQWRDLSSDWVTEPEERTARRRAIVGDYLRQGLVKMMRESYPLMVDFVRAQAGSGVVQDQQTASRISQISRPGMNVQPNDQPLDADTMIEDYVAAYLAGIE